MDKLILFCFGAFLALVLIGAFIPGDMGFSIFGLMFWCTGWVIAIGRVRYGS